jgi:hypothetical protein
MKMRATLARVAGVLLLTLPLATGGAYNLRISIGGNSIHLCILVTIIILCFWLRRVTNSDVVIAI